MWDLSSDKVSGGCVPMPVFFPFNFLCVSQLSIEPYLHYGK